MKVVVDTNNFVSALINKGPSFRIIELWRHEHFIVVTSQSILKEIRRVLGYSRIARRYNLTEKDVESLILLLERKAMVLENLPEIKAVAEDSDDDKFIACAVKAQADYIVSGDGHLLKLGKFKNISIVSARDFLKLFEKFHIS